MSSNITASMKTLVRAKTVARACQLFVRDFEPLGEDAIEAIPLLVGKLASLRGRAGENGLACLCYRGFIDIPDSLGATGRTVAIISITDRMIRNFALLAVPDMQTVVIGIQGSIQRGANAAEAIPHLTQWRRRLAAQCSDNTDRPQTGLQGVAGTPLMTLVGHVDAVILAAQNTRPAQLDETRAVLDDFARRAIKDRRTVFVKIRQICALVESLAVAIHRVRPRLQEQRRVELALTGMKLQCPACGTFTREAVRHLYLASKGGFKAGSVGDCVIFAGRKAASLATGRCPGCQVGNLICTFDPFATELQQTPWRRLISLVSK